MTTFIIVLIFFCFCFLVYKNRHFKLPVKSDGLNIFELILICSSTSFLLYFVFYHFSNYIWSFNIIIPPEKFIGPATVFSSEHDGIEGYVLYSLMFINIILSFIFTQLSSLFQNRVIYLAIFFNLAFISSIYFINIGFTPPMYQHNGLPPDLSIMSVVIGITVLLLLMQKYLHKTLLLLIIMVLLLPICFISTGPISFFDYSYIWAPALRMLNGVPVSEIYFQYDLFLSLLAALWMKLNLDLNLFQILGQFSFFMFFVGLYIFSKKFFINKTLPVSFLISLLTIRFYSLMLDPVSLFQVTPLRLDLWVILLLLIYYKGAYHWINAIVLGLLVLSHKNFGLLYLFSYIQLVFVLFVIDLIELFIDKKINFDSIKSLLQKHFFLNLKNCLIIFGFVLSSILLFKGFVPESALLFQKIGNGMMQISITSFYWYIPILYSLGFLLLLKHRHSLSPNYFHTGLLIIFIAIGNSMYFFGRSHEHNILNISGAIILTLFLLFDLLGQRSIVSKIAIKQRTNEKIIKDINYKKKQFEFRKRVVFVLPILFIAGAAYYYSEKISGKINSQYENFKKDQRIYPVNFVPENLATIVNITKNSKDVYFFDYMNDFPYYYYGKYNPPGYYNPCAAWLLKDSLSCFLQKLVAQNYYIVTTNLDILSGLLPGINYYKITNENGFSAISKNNAGLLLPETTVNPITHIGINSDFGKSGLTLFPIDLNNNFIVELLFKPRTEQDGSAIILSNTGDDKGYEGIKIQQKGPNQNQFIFTFGGGNSWSSDAPFLLHPNEWNYIVIAVKKNTFKIFNNGQMVNSGKLDFTIKNSRFPLIIADGYDQNNSFNGLIKEIKITNDSITEQIILKTLNSVKLQLN